MHIGARQEYKVFVRTITFNQSLYIRDNLDGVAMQQTNFPFLHFVIDDASVDGEQDVIIGWLDEHCDIDNAEYIDTPLAKVIIVGHKTNVNCTYVVYLLKQNLYSNNEEKKKMYMPWREHCEYEALCEGDDYWTDPNKLQKQVEFLDKNPDYTMCFHAAIVHWENCSKEDRLFCKIEDREYSGEEVFRQWTIATASVVMRMSIVNSELLKRASLNRTFIYGDIIMFLTCAHYGKLYGMSDVMSVYRKQPGGAVYNYNAERQKKQAYHELEMYKIFGDRYKDISIQRFSKSAMEAFWGVKANGKIDLKLLLDIAICSPSTLLHEIIKRIRG